jgi:fructose-specific phosphotransferase system IIC component
MTELFNHEIGRVIGSTEKRPKIMPEWLYALMWILAIAIPAIAFTMKIMWWALDADQTTEAQQFVKPATESAANLASGASA